MSAGSRILVLSACLILTGITTVLIADHPANRTAPTARPAIEDPDQPDHPNARWAWERRRLADPATGRIPPGIHQREQLFASTLPRRTPGRGVGGGRLAHKTHDWEPRGPWNVGGRTRALALDVSDPGLATILAGGVSGGMWRSTDDGVSWTLTTGSSQLHAVTTVAQDTRPGHQHVWYYGTGEARQASPDWNGDKYWGDGLFKSVDGGLSWTQLASTASASVEDFDSPWDAVWRVATDPTNLAEDEVYAATHGLIFRSVDGGANWTAVLGDTGQLSKYSEVVVAPDGVVYATLGTQGGVHGIFRSPDGIQWTDISPAGLDPEHGRITLAVAPSQPEIVYVLTSNPTSSSIRKLYRYEYLGGDGSGGGGQWIDRSLALDRLPNPWTGQFNYPLVTQRGYNLTLAVNPTDPDEVYLGCVHLWRSPTGFSFYNTTERVGGWLYSGRSHHADQHALVFRPGSSTVAYTGSDGGVHRSDDITAANVSWIDCNNGYSTSQFYTVAQDPTTPDDPVVLGGTQDNGTLWTDEAGSTAPWVEIYGGDGAHCAVLSGVDNDYLVSYYFANVIRLQVDDDGDVIRQTRVNPVGGEGYQFINPFIVDPYDRYVLYLASGQGVWRNEDVRLIPWDGYDPVDEGWDHLTTQPADELVTALAINGQEHGTLYYGTEVGHLYAVAQARTAPQFIAPTPLHEAPSFPQEGGYLSSIAVHPDDDQSLLLCFGNYHVSSLWSSADGGLTWLDVEGNLAGDDGPSVRCVAMLADGDTDLWLCGTSTGMYSMRVDHATGPVGDPIWTLEAPETVGNVVVDAIDVRRVDRRVVAATHGRGIFSTVVPEATDVPVLAGARLFQNNPNPFNPSTEIAFELPTAGRVRLAIHDLRGRLVRVLVDGELEAGRQSAMWDGRDESGRSMASGVYTYRLDSAAETQQRTMTLVR